MTENLWRRPTEGEKPGKDLPPARASDAEHVSKVVEAARRKLLGLGRKDAG
jgi:hypothetical protein